MKTFASKIRLSKITSKSKKPFSSAKRTVKTEEVTKLFASFGLGSGSRQKILDLVNDPVNFGLQELPSKSQIFQSDQRQSKVNKFNFSREIADAVKQDRRTVKFSRFFIYYQFS